MITHHQKRGKLGRSIWAPVEESISLDPELVDLSSQIEAEAVEDPIADPVVEGSTDSIDSFSRGDLIICARIAETEINASSAETRAGP